MGFEEEALETVSHLLSKGHSRKSKLYVVMTVNIDFAEEQVSSDSCSGSFAPSLKSLSDSLWLERTGNHLLFKEAMILRGLSLCVGRNYLLFVALY